MHRGWMLVLLGACGRLGFDASAVDARADPGTSICDEDLSGVLFCESFEGDRTLRGGVVTPPTFVMEEDGVAYRGRRALHAHSTRQNEAAWILGGVLPALTSGDLWARWYIYIPASQAQFDLASVHLVEAEGANNGAIAGFNETSMTVSLSETGVFDQTALSIARDTWHCVQMHVVIANAGGSVDTFFDGAPGPRVTNTDTLPAAGYTNVHAGMWATSTAAIPMDLWTDELILSTAPIACD